MILNSKIFEPSDRLRNSLTQDDLRNRSHYARIATQLHDYCIAALENLAYRSLRYCVDVERALLVAIQEFVRKQVEVYSILPLTVDNVALPHRPDSLEPVPLEDSDRGRVGR